jgi:hypothetical protein
VAERSETFREVYNALAKSKDIRARIGPDFHAEGCASNDNAASNCTKRWGIMGIAGRTSLTRLQSQDDFVEMGIIGAHELLHAAGMFSGKLGEIVPASCGNEHDAAAAHDCTDPLEARIRDEVRRSQEAERHNQASKNGSEE